MKPQDPLFEVSDLSVVASTREGPKTVLDTVGFSIGAGQTLGIIGETGSGKTALVRALIGELPTTMRVTSGRVLVRGETHNLVEGVSEALRSECAAILSSGRIQLNPMSTVRNQLMNAVTAHSNLRRRAASERSKELLRLVQLPNLQERMNSYPHELSGGMSQRVFIAMALASSPAVLLADEPTYGLDVTIQKQILDLISSMAGENQIALLLVTRDLGIVAHYSSNVVVMKEGRIIEVASTRRFFRNPKDEYSQGLVEAARGAL